jgi:hypothetical protein
MPATFSNESGRTAFVLGQLGAPALQSGLGGKGAVMSDELDWNFRGPDNAKAEIRAAVGYLLKDAAASDRSDIVWDVIAIVNQVARSRGHDPLDDGMPGG